jgi:hypothetical protein
MDYDYVIPSKEAQKAAQKRGKHFKRIAAKHSELFKLSQEQLAEKMYQVRNGISNHDAKRIMKAA